MPYLKTKLTNDICKIISKNDLKFKLTNININGQKRGCSGHITYLPTGRCVYVNTEPLITNPNKLMYRYAKDEKDYSSHHTDFQAMNCFTSANTLAKDIATALTCPKQDIRSIICPNKTN